MADLVAHWRSDEAIGPTAEDSVGQNHGTLVNSPAWTTGKLGQALRFNGIDQYVAISSDGSINNIDNLTFAAWLRPDSAGGGNLGRILDADGTDFRFFMRTTPAIEFEANRWTSRGAWRAPTGVPFGTWFHFAIVYSYSSLESAPTFYMNGVNMSHIQTITPAGSVNTIQPTDFYIGNANDYTNVRNFDGLIDDVRIYKRELSAQEIAEIYNDGNGCR